MRNGWRIVVAGWMAVTVSWAASVCEASFPGAINSTRDAVTLIWGARITGTRQIVTQKLHDSPGATCDGARCVKTGTLASKLEFALELGSGKDGVFASAWNRGTASLSKIGSFDGSISVADASEYPGRSHRSRTRAV